MPSIVKHYNRTTSGAEAGVAAPGGVPFNNYSVQLKGVAAAPTSYTLTLEGSNDNANWTTLATQTPDGTTVFAVDKPCLYMRANLSALSLGSATSVDIYIVGASA
jgi:hypothetical protein